MLRIVGTTPDGRKVARGVYRFYETEGLPLDVILEALRAKGVVPDWPGFILEAVEAGMKPERAISMLETAIADSFGAKMRDVVVFRLRMLINPSGPPPKATLALRLLGSEYDAIYERVSKLENPSVEFVMGIFESVLGSEVVAQMQGEVVGFEIVEKLPESRFERL